MSELNTGKTGEKVASGNRLAKVIARAGLCSRRQAESWIVAGRVEVNGKQIRTPAFNVSESDKIIVDGKPLQSRQGTRVWLYHKPAGFVVTEKDPEGRATIFKELEKHGLPRVLSVGRLDINTEGLLLLTNDGGLKRVLELPATGWLRRYRVRAHGRINQEKLDKLKNGMEVDGIKYGSIDAKLESSKGTNVWINVALREGKNREIKNVLAALGLQVNRLIRTSYGPFQLSDLPMGTVSVVKSRILREQLGKRLAVEAGVDFDSPLPDDAVFDEAQAKLNPNKRFGKKRVEKLAQNEQLAQNEELQQKETAKGSVKPRGNMPAEEEVKVKQRKPAPSRKGNFEYKMRDEYVKEEKEKRVVHFGGKRGKEEFIPQAKRKKPEDEEGGFGKRGSFDKKGGGKFDKPRGKFSRDDKPRGDKPRGGKFDRDDKPRGGKPSRGKFDRSDSPRSDSSRSDKKPFRRNNFKK